jgi:HSP20 family protein
MSQALTEPRKTTPARANQLERWAPMTDLDQFEQRMQQFLDQTFGSLAPAARGGVVPHVDIEEQDDAYVLEAELPGVKREDVTIEQVGNELMISGEFKERERKGIVRRQTRQTGRFDYRVALPESVESEKIEAKLKDGVLTLRVPKSTKAQRRRIEIGS